jgi:hypothetical protein
MDTLIRIKDILLNNPKVRTMYWQALNVAVGIVILVVGELDARWAVLILPVLMYISKELNKKFLPDVTL